MMYFIFIIKSSLQDFRRNKVRTFLTSLGILIGVGAVVLLMSLGLGLKKYISDQFESMGSNTIMVMPGKVVQNGQFSQGGGGGMVGGVKFDEKDITTIKRIKTAAYVVPFFVKTGEVSAEGKTETTQVHGTTADVFNVITLGIEAGEYFTKPDVDKKNKVMVIGSKIAEKLYGSANESIGKTIKIEGQAYKVIGALASKGGGGLGNEFDTASYIPHTAGYSFNPDKKFIMLYVKADNETNLADTKTEVKTSLLKRYKEDQFSVIESTELLQAINNIFSMLNLILIAIAAISLVVGGIGIMNIMYVSVTERTREIGIRRAVGALKLDILWQFLAEAVILSAGGGLLGLGIAELGVLAIQKVIPAYIDLPTVLVALGVSSFIGLLFGVFPARRASQLSPIEAIRYE